MSDRSNQISKIISSHASRVAYIQAKLAVLVPAQIRSVRIRSTNPPMPKQKDLAREADLHQSRISMFETPGAANITLETLAKIAAGLRVGVIVKLVPFHEMLEWDNSFSPSTFNVRPRLEEDEEFINPASAAKAENRAISSTDGNNLGGTPDEQSETQASNAKRPPGKELFAQGAAVGGA